MGSARGASAACILAAVAMLAAGCGKKAELHVPVAKVAGRLPSIRGLHFKRIPSIQPVSKSELAKLSGRQLATELRRLTPAGRARLARIKRELVLARELPILLGLIPAHLSSGRLDKIVQTEGVYDGLANRIYLIRDYLAGDPQEAEVVLAHELTHALDQQNLGSGGLQLRSPLLDAPDAERAVREGSAVFSQARYAIRYLGQPGPVSLYLRLLASPPSGDRLARLAQRELQLTYVDGARFVYALYRRGGWRLVNRALRSPPSTTASILFPGRWPAHDLAVAPPGDPASALRSGWARVVRGDMGDFNTAELLADAGPRAAVEQLVRDWRGGRVELWQRRGVRVDSAAPARSSSTLAIQWAWRAPVDTAAAEAALASYLVATFHATSAGGGAWRVAGGAAAYASRGAATALVLAPSPALARAAARAAAGP